MVCVFIQNHFYIHILTDEIERNSKSRLQFLTEGERWVKHGCTTRRRDGRDGRDETVSISQRRIFWDNSQIFLIWELKRLKLVFETETGTSRRRRRDRQETDEAVSRPRRTIVQPRVKRSNKDEKVEFETKISGRPTTYSHVTLELAVRLLLENPTSLISELPPLCVMPTTCFMLMPRCDR